MSYSQAMRLHVLRLLASPAVECLPSEREVVKRCLQGEEVSLDVQGVRERVLRIGRVCQAVPDGNTSAADLAGRWLLGKKYVLSLEPGAYCISHLVQMKVNLRPLWSAAMGALSMLSERFGDLVWNLVFSDLQHMCDTDAEPGVVIPSWMKNESDEVDTDDIQEVEKTWRDPSAHKMRVSVVKWASEDRSRLDLIKVIGTVCPY
jgi:U3 small nucleolar RNA-associated protein 20